MKARIVERTRKDGSIRYVIQQKILFWWFDTDNYHESLSEAKKRFCFYDGTKEKDRVLYTGRSRSPNPETKKITDKLFDIFKDKLSNKAKLSNKKCLDDYLESLAPYVKEEYDEDITHAVNEASEKVFIIKSPCHGRKVIFIEEEFAEKVLALGDLP